MTVAERIRKAALGPTPRENADLTAGWLRYPRYAQAWDAMRPWCDNQPEPNFMTCNDNTERRMFLLFVAEAIEGAQ
jgi:hypothetical protein